jgi:hypothetical protein
VIIEIPKGVFTLYSTSAVSQANLGETALDAADSKDSVLLRPQALFSHAWLLLGTSAGAHGGWFAVF